MAISLWERARGNRDIALVSSLTTISQAAVTLIFFASSIGVFSLIAGLWAIGVASLFAFLAFLSAIWFSFEYADRRRHFLQDWNPRIWTRERMNSAVIHNITDIDYYYRLIIVILSDGASEFLWRVGWTGHGRITPAIKNKGFWYRMVPSGVDDCHILHIYFDRPRKKGDVIELEFDLQTRGSIVAQSPFFSATMFGWRLPKSSEIAVKFADTVDVRSVVTQTYVSDKAAWPIEPPTECKLDNNRSVTWRINAKRGYRYCISWEY